MQYSRGMQVPGTSSILFAVHHPGREQDRYRGVYPLIANPTAAHSQKRRMAFLVTQRTRFGMADRTAHAPTLSALPNVPERGRI